MVTRYEIRTRENGQLRRQILDASFRDFILVLEATCRALGESDKIIGVFEFDETSGIRTVLRSFTCETIAKMTIVREI